MKARTRFKPTIGQGLRMLLCAIFRVEMDMEIDAEEVCHVRKPNKQING
jgi:hypothetical protein